MRWEWLAMALMVSACATAEVGPTPEERKAAYEATNIYPANYKAEIVAYLRTFLNDPTGIRDAVVSEPEQRKSLGDRYTVCLRFTPKKNSGWATRQQPTDGPPSRDSLAVFVSGKFDRLVPARDECREAAYKPFPELERIQR